MNIMLHKAHNHPKLEEQLGLDRDHVIIDRKAWEHIIGLSEPLTKPPLHFINDDNIEVIVNFVPHYDKKEHLETLTIQGTEQHDEYPIKDSYIVDHENGSFRIDEHLREDGYWSLIKKAIDEYIN